MRRLYSADIEGKDKGCAGLQMHEARDRLVGLSPKCCLILKMDGSPKDQAGVIHEQSLLATDLSEPAPNPYPLQGCQSCRIGSSFLSPQMESQRGLCRAASAINIRDFPEYDLGDGLLLVCSRADSMSGTSGQSDLKNKLTVPEKPYYRHRHY